MSAWGVAMLAPFAICVVIIGMLRRATWTRRLADLPNHRSLHERPTPRIGGIAIVLSAVPIAWVLASGDLQWTWALALGLALLSFVDDLRSLPIKVRLSAHFAAAGVAVATLAPGLWEAQGLFAATIVVFAIAWMTNLYNFMDGADGLAGGMAVIGFGAYAIAANSAGDLSIALGSLVLASSALAFLLFNFPPARVFMGDAGSVPMGFLAGALGLRGAVDGAWPPWFPFVVFAPFVVDSTMTLARRLFRGERFWIAHRSHCYQRLVLSGWTTRRLAMNAYAVMAAGAASALVALHEGATIQCAILGFWSLLYIIAMLAIERRSPLDSAS